VATRLGYDDRGYYLHLVMITAKDHHVDRRQPSRRRLVTMRCQRVDVASTDQPSKEGVLVGWSFGRATLFHFLFARAEARRKSQQCEGLRTRLPRH
jgi:hypothetical protein